MNKHYYPAIFHPEDMGYSVTVPDLDGCFTQGDTMDEAIDMTQEAIGLMVTGMTELPTPSIPSAFSCEAGDFITVIPFDLVAYHCKHDTKAVKKTLTIPSWLNTMAEEHQINFSRVLQSALREQLNITD